MRRADSRIGRHRLHSEIEPVQLRDLRNIQSRPIRRASRSADGRHIVMRDRIHIERHIAAQVGQSVRSIEVAEPRTWVIAPRLFLLSAIVRIEKAVKERMQSYGCMVGSAPDDGPLKPELEID